MQRLDVFPWSLSHNLLHFHQCCYWRFLFCSCVNSVQLFAGKQWTLLLFTSPTCFFLSNRGQEPNNCSRQRKQLFDRNLKKQYQKETYTADGYKGSVKSFIHPLSPVKKTKVFSILFPYLIQNYVLVLYINLITVFQKDLQGHKNLCSSELNAPTMLLSSHLSLLPWLTKARAFSLRSK